MVSGFMVLRSLGLGGAAFTNPHNRNKVRYALISIVIAAFALLVLFGIHGLPSNENIQYVGSPNGYEAFVPHDTINYNGHIDPEGDLILNNGTILHNTVLDGQYANTIIQNHNQIVQLNNQLNGDMQDFYVIKGPVPAEQVTIDGQTYIVIEADKINPADIAGFYTYQAWVPNFVAAINTPGTYAAVLPGNSPVFQWKNLTETVAERTMLYEQYNPYIYVAGGDVLVQPNGTIIPYGVTSSPLGSALFNFTTPQQSYNPPS